jgi:hypothetical protein
VNPQKVERDMLPAGKSVASRITHRRWTGGTALLSQRHGLLNEAEEEFGHIRLFRFASAFRATLSRRLLRIQQSRFNKAPLSEHAVRFSRKHGNGSGLSVRIHGTSISLSYLESP